MKKLLIVLAVSVVPSIVAALAPAAAQTQGRVCGGFAGVPCAAGQYCDWPPNRCAAADIQGRCVRVPEVCTQDYKPVCGCDGRTYSNDCMRLQARARKAGDGPCQ